MSKLHPIFEQALRPLIEPTAKVIPIIPLIERKCAVVGDHPMEVLERVYDDGMACLSCEHRSLDEQHNVVCEVREAEVIDPYECPEVCDRLEDEE